MTSCSLLGDSFLLDSTRAFLTSVVMCFRWSLKSSMGLICTPSFCVICLGVDI